MITDPIQSSDIRYNAASGCFEAKVTVHGAGPARVYACEWEGDLSLSPSEIETGLRQEALRRHTGARGLSSQRRTSEPRPLHSARDAAPRPSTWFDRFPLAALRAA